MKMRTSVILFTTLAFVSLFLLSQIFLLAPHANASPTPYNAIIVAPSPTPTLSDTITSAEKAVFDPIMAFLSFAAALLIAILVILLVWRFWSLSRLTSLDIDTFKNATTNSDLDKVLTGFTERTRQKLESVKKEFGRLRLADQVQMPGVDVKKRLDELEKTVQDVTSGTINSALSLLNPMFLPSGTRVTPSLSDDLQSLDGMPAKLVISLDVTDIRDPQKRKIYTIWEEQPNPLAEISSPQPTAVPVDKVAQASYNLGKLFEELGVLDQAKSHYEDALKKHPDYPDAKDALKRMLKKSKLEERYTILLDPVAYSLVIEHYRRSLAAEERRFRSQEERIQYRAKLYNYIGLIYEFFAMNGPAFLCFYQLAIADFKMAKMLVKNWYQPYENLADVYRERGQDKKGIDRQRQSLDYYDEALKYVHTAIPPYLSVESEDERKTIERRILSGKAITKLLTGDQVFIREAKEQIEQIVKGWDATSKRNDSFLLYNLAYWYATAAEAGVDVADAQQAACRYLAYGLARARDSSPFLWEWPLKEDPDLRSINKDKRIALADKLEEIPDLPNKTGKPFADAISEVLKKANLLSS